MGAAEIKLALIAVVVLAIVWLIWGVARQAKSGAKAKQEIAEGEVEERAKAQSRLDKYLAGRGSAGAWLRRKRMQDSSKD